MKGFAGILRLRGSRRGLVGLMAGLILSLASERESLAQVPSAPNAPAAQRSAPRAFPVPAVPGNAPVPYATGPTPEGEPSGVIDPMGAVRAPTAAELVQEADRLLKLNNFQGAIKLPDLAIQRDPQAFNAHYSRHYAMYCLGRYDEAISELDFLIANKAHLETLYLNRANLYRYKNEDEAALADYDRAIAITPANAQVRLERSLCLHALKRTEECVEELTKALELEPDNSVLLVQRGFELVRLGRHRLALRDFNKALAIDPNVRFGYVNRGISHLRLGHYAEALADYDRAIERRPKDVQILSYRASCLEGLGRSGAALVELRKALEIKPGSPKLLKQKAWLLAGICSYEEAIQDLDLLIAVEPYKSYGYQLRAYCYLSLNQPERALEDSSKALGLSFDGASLGKTYWLRATIQKELGHSELARADAKRAMDLSGDSVGLMLQCAMLLAGLGEYEESRQVMDRLVEQAPRLIIFRGLRAYDEAGEGDYKAMLADLGWCVLMAYADRDQIMPTFHVPYDQESRRGVLAFGLIQGGRGKPRLPLEEKRVSKLSPFGVSRLGF